MVRMEISMRTVLPVILATALSGAALASIDFSLSGVEVQADGFTTIGTVASGDAGIQVESIQLTDAQLTTFNNTGIPNHFDEILLAIELADAAGNSVLYYFFPFGDDFSSGTIGPADMTIDVIGQDLYIPDDGIVTASTASIWDDGSPSPAAEWDQGQMLINLVPAPGVAAILGLGLLGTRGRRRSRT